MVRDLYQSLEVFNDQLSAVELAELREFLNSNTEENVIYESTADTVSPK